jgi:hypothetical protein
MGKKRYPDFTKTVSVVCPDHTRFLLDGKQYFPCGYSASACLTISSKSDGKVVLSLLRGIKSLFGREIEPFELPIDAVKTLSDEELLMIYMVKLLLYP